MLLCFGLCLPVHPCAAVLGQARGCWHCCARGSRGVCWPCVSGAVCPLSSLCGKQPPDPAGVKQCREESAFVFSSLEIGDFSSQIPVAAFVELICPCWGWCEDAGGCPGLSLAELRAQLRCRGWVSSQRPWFTPGSAGHGLCSSPPCRTNISYQLLAVGQEAPVGC